MLLEDEYYCVGDEKEVKNYSRKIFFDNNDIEISGKYNVLLPKYQDIVRRVLYELPDNDVFGFNLKRFLEGYKKATPSVSQLKISREMATFINQTYTIDEYTLDKQINTAKKRGILREGNTKSGIETYISYLCECFLTEDSLLKKGIGKKYTIKSEWHDRFFEDLNSSPFRKQFTSETGQAWSTFQCVKNYEDYLRKINELKENDSVLEEKWAVMTYSGAYQLLKNENSRQNEKRAVDRLINDLYFCQLINGEMPTIEGHI